MANFDNISNGFFTQFSTDVYMLARLKDSLYLPHVDVMFTNKKAGERQVIHRMGEVTATKVTGRYEELDAQTAPMTARSAVIDKYHAYVTLEELDDMKMIFDPSGPYVKTISAALAKKMDQVIKDALVGSADDKTGASSTAFDSNQIVDSSAALTVAKLVEARNLFNNAFIAPGAGITGFVEGNGYTDLLNITAVTSSDFRNVQSLNEGVIGRFLGIDFYFDPLMPKLLSDGTTNQAILFTKQAVAVALPQDVRITVDRIPERRNSWLIQADFVMGAVRVEENQVVIVKHT